MSRRIRNFNALTATLVASALALILSGAASSTRVDAQTAHKPLSKEDVIHLLKGDVAPKRVATIAHERGIDFQLRPETESELRRAGATDELMATLRELAPKPPAPKPAQIVVETSPNAQVYLDDEFKGQASAEGRLVIGNPNPGEHALRVSLAGKKDYEEKITVVAGQATTVKATLPDLPGSIRVQTSAGAEVFLDDSSRGTASPSGQLVISNVAAGDHALRVSLAGKKTYEGEITVVAGQEATVRATLAAIQPPSPTSGPARENPKDGLKYVWIPPGTFQMGCSHGDSECVFHEKPSHQVTITKGFWLGQTPVTVAAYRRYSAASGNDMPEAPYFNSGWNDHGMPIVNVSWDDAVAFCTWAGGRLPSEAEWEYAARAGSTESRYGPIDEVAWFGTNSGLQAHDVAQKRPNRFNLYDMLGNVWEWVGDWYGDYHASPKRDPQGPKSGKYRVLRGGPWGKGNPGHARVSDRIFGVPSGRILLFGFRCVGEVGNP